MQPVADLPDELALGPAEAWVVFGNDENPVTPPAVALLRVDVDLSGRDLVNAVARPQRLTPSFDAVYREFVVNYPRAEKAGVPATPGTWLVICRDNAGVISRLQPLLEWRRRKGFPVRVRPAS